MLAVASPFSAQLFFKSLLTPLSTLQVENNGFQHPQPEDCPDEIYKEVILPSLQYDAADRPRFKQIVEALQKLSGEHEYEVLWPEQ